MRLSLLAMITGRIRRRIAPAFARVFFARACTSCTVALLAGATMATPAFAGTATAAITVDTEVAASCTFTSIPALDMGIQPVPTAAAIVPATLGLQCAAATPWSLRIDQGQNYNGTLNMRRTGQAETLAYAMCADAACTAPLSTSAGPDGTGTGTPQAIVIAARLVAGQSPPPGSYTDTLSVRIEY